MFDRKHSSAGMTVVEVLVVVTSVLLLITLALPAVQSAREAARRTACLNNLRSLGLGAALMETTHQHLPGAVLNAHPSRLAYRKDTGVFVSMLPFLEQQILYDAFNKDTTTADLRNKHLLSKRPSILKCPSAPDSQELHAISQRFSGPPDNVSTISCDYVGNGGCIRNGIPMFGTIRVRVGVLSREKRMRDISDGTSQTLLFWESRGDAIFSSDGTRGSADEKGLEEFKFLISESRAHDLHSQTLASYKTYVLGWIGFRIGAVLPTDERALNVSNKLGEPFSAHPGVVPCAFSDGGVRTISSNVDGDVVESLATVNGQEIEQL